MTRTLECLFTEGETVTKQLFSVNQLNGTGKPVPYGCTTIESYDSTTLVGSRREFSTVPLNIIDILNNKLA